MVFFHLYSLDDKVNKDVGIFIRLFQNDCCGMFNFSSIFFIKLINFYPKHTLKSLKKETERFFKTILIYVLFISLYSSI